MFRHSCSGIKPREFAGSELGKIYKSKVRRDKLLGMYTKHTKSVGK